MSKHPLDAASTTGGLPVAPSLGPSLEAADFVPQPRSIDRRVVFICALSMAIAAAAALVAGVLTRLISLVTNISFFGKFSSEAVSPADNHLGWAVIAVPIIGAVLVGLMARYGSKAIRGHGIPEAMEQVLLHESRIPARITLLKPLSAAISIGTGGPFGAEGPIIATGGAIGSLVGQLLRTTSAERKTLLAAGAAAGMAATFGSPVSAALLAVELLLFEYRPRSLIPVALATTTACGVHVAMYGGAPAFAMPTLAQPSGSALFFYIVLGALMGLVSIVVTRAVYAIEDAFERLPFHWMWWPALGAIAVGVVGFISPRTMGVGYDNIDRALSGSVPLQALAALTIFKFISWSISLGSGTSGGTLAPLFTLGGGVGGLVGAWAASAWPALGVDARLAALVGMAAIFAGASRALLASVVFAFETTRQPMGLLPLLGGCSASFLLSSLFMRHSIMTEKIARRGVRVSAEYGVDLLSQLLVKDFATRALVTLQTDDPVSAVLAQVGSPGRIAAHHGYPVVDASGSLAGVVTRRDLLESKPGQRVGELLRGPAVVVREETSLREAVDLMAQHQVGRLPVIDRGKLVGILTRGDVLTAHGMGLREGKRAEPSVVMRMPWPNEAGGSTSP
jgi:CIC family chloride channel protein